MTRTRWILAAVVLAAVVNSAVMTIAWWLAAWSGDWSVTLRFGEKGEQWVEGILFHILTLLSVYSIWYFRPGGRYGRH